MIEPTSSAAATPFWDATREQRLVLQWCPRCETPIHYPREVCPTCLGSDLEWRTAVGTGAVYAFTVEHRPSHPALAGRAPFTIALVDLAEGPRVATNIVSCAVEDVTVGMPVSIAWEPLPDGRHLPVFEPAGTRHD